MDRTRPHNSNRASAGLLVLLAILFTGVLTQAEAAEPLHRVAPPAAWVAAATPDYDTAAPTDAGTDGSWYLLLDRQINVTSGGNDAYQHIAVKLTSKTGVEDQSQINVSIDPAFQSLDIHFLRVVRGTTRIDQIQRARITELPEETELQERIYNGHYNVNVLLADVRIGDVVEYAFTIHTRERLFSGHFATLMTVGWSSPVHDQRLRIRSPAARTLYARLSDGGQVPPFQVRGDTLEFAMRWQDLAAITAEEDQPAWFSPWPSLMVSDLSSWAEVAQRVDPLYAAPLQGSPKTSAIAKEIQQSGGTPEEQALRALQYVQEQIRYTSIAIGPGSHRPTNPDTVLARRFGDCKDKSVLLAVLLNHMGIEATPALVHSRRGRMLGEVLPTPYAFDHVVVRLRIGENVYWVDGTSVKQMTPLSTDDPADFEQALLLRADAKTLVAIPRPASDVHRHEISMVFDLKEGVSQPAKLAMTTRYSGSLADRMRVALARKSAEQRRSDYVNYTARYYPTAKSAGEVRIDDDISRDTIEIHERYTPRWWLRFRHTCVRTSWFTFPRTGR
jgi:transglutaminase-like putative cysteine protease